MRVEFRHHAVRDLAWVISSASLIMDEGDDRVSDAWCRFAFYDRIPWLRELDRHPEVLTAWLTARRGRLLGHYFEALIEYWLRHWRRMSIHAVRLQVREAERAVGEFDFLFSDRFRDIDYHWEAAVKFFLRFRHPDGRVEWLGPNPRDTLQSKLDKVFTRQLLLSSHPAAVPLLSRLGIGPLSSRAFIKGYLFYPAASDWRRSDTLPADSSPRHLKGWWCYANEAEHLPDRSEDERWCFLPRHQWLSAVRSREAMPGMSREVLLASVRRHFENSDKPLLLAGLWRDEFGLWREWSRGFVVADHWPGNARSLDREIATQSLDPALDYWKLP